MKEHNLKVGDELAFSLGNRGNYYIYKIDKITPTGRIKCGRYELDPDLRVRGRSGHSGPYRGEIVTPEILAEVKRQDDLLTIGSCRFRDLDSESLGKIAEIIESAKKVDGEDSEDEE